MGRGSVPPVLTAEVSLADGTRVLLRPIRPTDKTALEAGFERLSPDSRYRRFFAPMPRLTPAALVYLTEVDGVQHVAMVALVPQVGEPPAELGVGVARYIRLPDRADAAEVAIAVTDDYQGRGVGLLLLDGLTYVALRAGLSTFVAIVRSDNSPMRRMLQGVGARLESESGGIQRFEVDLRARVGPLRAGRLGPALGPGADAAGG